jgi:LysR family transcriptional regulator for metE and metH
MVAANRGVAALPDWLARQYASSLPLSLLRLGERGLQKHIFVGCRQQERQNTPIATFIQLAKSAVAPVATAAPEQY